MGSLGPLEFLCELAWVSGSSRFSEVVLWDRVGCLVSGVSLWVCPSSPGPLGYLSGLDWCTQDFWGLSLGQVRVSGASGTSGYRHLCHRNNAGQPHVSEHRTALCRARLESSWDSGVSLLGWHLWGFWDLRGTDVYFLGKMQDSS